ncbi:nucleotide-diphospho-sugar transferase [Hesseltinella vesiculosa]|uniref:Nucleotide-diphospho-sugar transferase n=1 Tax=Hesseltinella vesiculosa TaxID=101127 RepID=A0A1X2GMT9_9FUNG|nr:nucleotide-diphospho-sugar transferase [Hesseltinella vesiculosa]
MTKLRTTMHNLEDRFNRERNYPYIVFTEDEPTDEFKTLVSATANGNVIFAAVGKTPYFGYPKHISLEKAAEARVNLKDIVFGDSENFRFKARFIGGTMFTHPAMSDLDYYWHFEAGTQYPCNINYDVFEFMQTNKYKMSYNMFMFEFKQTIPSLHQSLKKFMYERPGDVILPSDPDSLWPAFVNGDDTLNNCHFWNNFQIGDARFFRGKEYQRYFEHIEREGGIFYERWADPIITTFGAVSLLRKQEVHYFDNICYKIPNVITFCPDDKRIFASASCRPHESFDQNKFSCLDKLK